MLELQVTPTPTSVADIGQRKSKKKRACTPEVSESSGEEYDPSRGDTAAAMSVAAPKPRLPRSKTRKINNNKSKLSLFHLIVSSGILTSTFTHLIIIITFPDN